jgi:hypothetical protein
MTREEAINDAYSVLREYEPEAEKTILGCITYIGSNYSFENAPRDFQWYMVKCRNWCNGEDLTTLEDKKLFMEIQSELCLKLQKVAGGRVVNNVELKEVREQVDKIKKEL